MNAAHLFNVSVMKPGRTVLMRSLEIPSMATRWFRAMYLPLGDVIYAIHEFRGTSKSVDNDVFTSIMQ